MNVFAQSERRRDDEDGQRWGRRALDRGLGYAPLKLSSPTVAALPRMLAEDRQAGG